MNPIAAARAYQAIQGAGSAGAVSPTDAPGFSELVQNVLASATTQTRAAETQMTQVVQGQADRCGHRHQLGRGLAGNRPGRPRPDDPSLSGNHAYADLTALALGAR